MLPNSPPTELILARLHISDMLREAEQQRRCPKTATRQIIAAQLRQLANRLAPQPVRSGFDQVTSPTGSGH